MIETFVVSKSIPGTFTSELIPVVRESAVKAKRDELLKSARDRRDHAEKKIAGFKHPRFAKAREYWRGIFIGADYEVYHLEHFFE